MQVMQIYHPIVAQIRPTFAANRRQLFRTSSLAKECTKVMSERVSELDFDNLSWHDNIVYGLRLDVGDTSQGDWHHDLIFDIDHIVEWACGVDGSAQFRVAPATLTFHEVTDLRVAVDFGASDCRMAINEMSIADVSRSPVDDKERFPDLPYYRWRIELNLPQGGEIAFGARGFTQDLRAAPEMFDQPRMPAGYPR